MLLKADPHLEDDVADEKPDPSVRLQLREAIKIICVFLLDIVQKWPRPAPLILDIHEATFVSAHFGQPSGNFCIGLKLKYVPNI